jgi:predicted outer membrane protein
LIGLLLAAVILAIALWLVFSNPRLLGGPKAPMTVSPASPPPAADTTTGNTMADEAARAALAASRAKAAKAKAEALAADRAVEAAQANAIEQNMTPAQNRLNEDYAAQVGDTRPAASATGDNATSPN